MTGELGVKCGSRWFEVSRTASQDGFVQADANGHNVGGRAKIYRDDDGFERVVLYLTLGNSLRGKNEIAIGKFTRADYDRLARDKTNIGTKAEIIVETRALIADYDTMVAHSEETGQGDPPEQSEAIAEQAIEILRKLIAE